MSRTTFRGTASAEHSLSGRVKITRAATGKVEYQDLPERGIEMYKTPEGILSATYPEGFFVAPVDSSLRRYKRAAAFGLLAGAAYLATKGHPWALGAIVWTDKGQEKNVDVIDPATRGAQVTTYYGGWGSGATAPAVGNTALVTENAEARVATTISQPAVNTIQWLWEVTASGNRVVNEAGVFTALTVGDMWIRLTLSTLNIETGDRVEFTVQLAFKDISE